MTAREMKHGDLNGPLHGLDDPIEVLLREKRIDARSTGVPTFSLFAEGCDPSEGALAYQRASGVSLAEDKRGG